MIFEGLATRFGYGVGGERKKKKKKKRAFWKRKNMSLKK